MRFLPQGKIEEARILKIMKDLGYPKEKVKLVGKIHTKSTTNHQALIKLKELG